MGRSDAAFICLHCALSDPSAKAASSHPDRSWQRVFLSIHTAHARRQLTEVGPYILQAAEKRVAEGLSKGDVNGRIPGRKLFLSDTREKVWPSVEQAGIAAGTRPGAGSTPASYIQCPVLELRTVSKTKDPRNSGRRPVGFRTFIQDAKDVARISRNYASEVSWVTSTMVLPLTDCLPS